MKKNIILALALIIILTSVFFVIKKYSASTISKTVRLPNLDLNLSSATLDNVVNNGGIYTLGFSDIDKDYIASGEIQKNIRIVNLNTAVIRKVNPLAGTGSYFWLGMKSAKEPDVYLWPKTMADHPKLKLNFQDGTNSILNVVGSETDGYAIIQLEYDGQMKSSSRVRIGRGIQPGVASRSIMGYDLSKITKVVSSVQMVSGTWENNFTPIDTYHYVVFADDGPINIARKNPSNYGDFSEIWNRIATKNKYVNIPVKYISNGSMNFNLDYGIDGLVWEKIVSTTIASIAPVATTSITIKIRASDNQSQLSNLPWKNVTSAGVAVGLPRGRFAEIKLDFKTTNPSYTPKLKMIKLSLSYLDDLQSCNNKSFTGVDQVVTPNYTLTSTVSCSKLSPPARCSFSKQAGEYLRATGQPIDISSMFRDYCGQDLLYSGCEPVVAPAARPGYSNHEGGLAYDVNGFHNWSSSKQVQFRIIAAKYGWYPLDAKCTTNNECHHFQYLPGLRYFNGQNQVAATAAGSALCPQTSEKLKLNISNPTFNNITDPNKRACYIKVRQACLTHLGI